MPRLYLPATFDAAAVPGLPAGQRQYAGWPVDAVVRRQLRDRVGRDTPVPLAREFIDAHVPKHLSKDLLACLVAGGVLTTSGKYARPRDGSPGRCREYALGPAHHAAPLVASPVTHPELTRKVLGARAAAESAAIATDPLTMRALRSYLDRVEVIGGPVGTDPALDALRHGNPWFGRCPYDRVHTPATSLACVNRCRVRLDGEELVTVDVRQSQPWLAARALATGTSPRGRKEGEGGGPEQERPASRPSPRAGTAGVPPFSLGCTLPAPRDE